MLDKSQWGYEQGSPSNTVEEVAEMTAEETFYSSGVTYPDEVMNYVSDLEQSVERQAKLLKDKNQAIREMLAAMLEARPDELGCYKLELDRILTLK